MILDLNFEISTVFNQRNQILCPSTYKMYGNPPVEVWLDHTLERKGNDKPFT